MGTSQASNTEYTLQPIEEGPYLEQARAWAKQRRVYVHHDFKDSALGRKHIGVFVNSALISVITVEIDGPGEYLISVTSPPRSDLNLVALATYHAGYYVFATLGARRIYTLSPVLNGRHAHRGSKGLCEMCGLTATGHTEVDEHGHTWAEYELTREDWLTFHQRAA